ncbi:unnamed protein product [Agarophyton chilense]
MGIVLQSHLYGRARDICKSIPSEKIQSANGAHAIVNALYLPDPLAVVSEVYQDFLTLLHTKGNRNESVKNFESRFQANVSRLNGHGEAAKLLEALVAFMFLSNCDVDNKQRVSVLANCAPKDSSFETNATTTTFLESISYSAIASVLRQCDPGQGSGSSQTNTLSSSAAYTQRNRTSNRSAYSRQRMTPEQLAEKKRRTKCNKCGKLGHWAGDHREGNSLKAGFKSYDAAPTQVTEQKNVLFFNMVTLGNESHPYHNFIGPLLDDGAPYSGIGMKELHVIKHMVCPDWNGNLDPIPDTIADRPNWQYGSGNHKSEPRRILGSIVLSARSNACNSANVRRVVVEGSTQWVIGRNVTQYCNIMHLHGNVFQLPATAGCTMTDTLSLTNRDMPSYVPHTVFTYPFNNMTPLNQNA